MRSRIFLALTLIFISQRVPADTSEFPGFIAAKYGEAVHVWINAHPEYRLALDEDCQCEDDIGSPADRQIHPYFAMGDFDGDGMSDFAIVALPKRTGLKILVVVFFGSNAGFGDDVSEIPLPFPDVSVAGLFVGKSNEKGKRQHAVLGFGPFESEWDELPVRRHRSGTTDSSGRVIDRMRGD